MKDFYLLTTAHLESCLWFRDEDDFKVAMNYVAIQAACCPDVDVLAFILMSNHVHFVLNGSQVDVEWFISQFKRRYSQYYRSRHGVQSFLRRNKVDIRLVDYKDDSLRRAIAYVQMNCVAANICSHPSQYQWGSGNSFFAQSKLSGVRIGDLSETEQNEFVRQVRFRFSADANQIARVCGITYSEAACLLDSI